MKDGWRLADDCWHDTKSQSRKIMDRQRSQLLGLLVLAILILLIACIRYYFKLG